jgi:hypothetical protein
MGIFSSVEARKNGINAENDNWNALATAVANAEATGKVNSNYVVGFNSSWKGWADFSSLIFQGVAMSESTFTDEFDRQRATRASWAKDLQTRASISLPNSLTQFSFIPQQSAGTQPGLLLIGALVIAAFFLWKKR